MRIRQATRLLIALMADIISALTGLVKAKSTNFFPCGREVIVDSFEMQIKLFRIYEKSLAKNAKILYTT